MPYYQPTYRYQSIATYPETPIWDSGGGTPPTTLVSAEYAWELNLITGWCHFVVAAVYTNQGTSNTTVALPIPSTAPQPAVIAGCGNAASEIVYIGTGADTNSVTQVVAASQRCWIARNAGDTAFDIVILTLSLNARTARAEIFYPTF